MVEHVEELRLELSLNSFSNAEVLEDGHVRHELAGPGELIAANVAELRNAGSCEGSTLSHDGGAIRSSSVGIAVRTVAKLGRHRSKVSDRSGLIVEAACSHVEPAS